MSDPIHVVHEIDLRVTDDAGRRLDTITLRLSLAYRHGTPPHIEMSNVELAEGPLGMWNSAVSVYGHWARNWIDAHRDLVERLATAPRVGLQQMAAE